MYDDVVLTKVLRQDRAIVIAGAAAISLLGWSYLIYEDWAMRHMDLVSMAMTFATINRSRHAKGRVAVSVWVFLAGYVASWTGFSFVATLAQWELHNLELISPMMVGTSAVLGSLVLISAGIYQWTPFKYACLRHCRAPLGFLVSYWRDGKVGAFLMGMRHGAYCLGCCWLLMAVLFAVGVMNLAWIIALSVFVLLEKLIPRGLIMARTAGAVLIGFGGWLALSGLV